MSGIISFEQQQLLVGLAFVFTVFVVASVFAYSALIGRDK